MLLAGRLKAGSLRCFGGASLVAAAAFFASAPAAAQTVATSPGFYVEAEGQAVFGDSDFDAGFVPVSIFAATGPKAELDEGNGAGGALTLGYVFSNGWSAAVRYRRLDASDKSGPYFPGIMAFAPGIPFAPGGIPFGVLDARTDVDSETTMLDLEIAKDLAFAGGRLELFGGITYTSIERDVTITETCGCVPFSLLMGHDFHGLGPKIGFRGGIPINGTISVVGGASVAALFGTSTFTSRLDDPLFPPFAFKDSDQRTVAALDGQAGLAFAIGTGHLTVGYRIDAVLGALDTDQRVSPLASSIGFPQIGDRRDDLIEHGPFARLTLPLAGAGD